MSNLPLRRKPSGVSPTGRLLTLAVLGPVLAWPMVASSPASAASCADLRTLSLPHTVLDVVETVRAAFTPPGAAAAVGDLPVFCRVHGFIGPVPGSKIGFELWLPQENWNGRLQMWGNGGYSSAIRYGDMGQSLKAGYATVATDTGHTGDDPDFATGRPEAIVDWGHRAVHEAVAAGKAIATAYYGKSPRYSYFFGCSTGGQQAFMEAQRYPDDFDGIAAGAPGSNRTHLNVGFLWQFLQNHEPRRNDRQIIPAAKLPMIADAAFAACRKHNGAQAGGLAADTYLNDPLMCDFDPATIQCTGDDGPACLTTAQVQALRKMYDGARNPNTGERIYFGWPVGSENAGTNPKLPGWSLYWADPKDASQPARVNFWRIWAFDKPDWKWWDLDFDRDVDALDTKLAPAINAMDPDLERFRRRGGKLLHYHGLADPVVPPLESISYYERVVEHQAQRLGVPAASPAALQATAEFHRLFLAPGLEHCQLGPGPNVLNLQDALESWVEKGIAPDRLIATKFVDDAPAQGVAVTRPLCPYPQQARHDGKGRSNEASSFICSPPEQRPPLAGPASRYLR